MPSPDPAASSPAPDLSRRGFLAASSGAALAGALGWSILSPTAASASDQNPDTDFMSGHYGMFIKIEDSRVNTGVDQGGTVGGWNAVANGFDVSTFAAQMADTGASWVVVYVGQNTGFYFGGNPDYETLAGVAPGSRLTSRDLMADIANALSAKGIKMFIYIPAGPAIDDTVAANNLGFTTRGGGDFGHDWYHTAAGDTNWAAVLRGWATHYGTKVSGWWIDGFFGPITSHYLGVTTTTAQKYATAIRAGNPHAVIGYNEWRFDNPTAAPYYDFTAGYVPPTSMPVPTSRWFDSNGTRVQWNLTMGQQFIGNSDFISYSTSVLAAGGSLMFEAFTDTSGRINNSTVYSQMRALKAAVTGTGTPITPYMWTAATGWQQTAAITVPSVGTTVELGPWPTSGGSWSWSGPNGYSANTREVRNIPLRTGSNVFTATHTNAGGAQSTQAFTVTVPGGTPITATASSVENSSLLASNAVDGNSSTRWSSQFSDPQWLQIDLGAPQTFTKVVLSWETAYGRDYQIQTSNDGTNWTTVYTRTGGSGGTETLTGFTGTGRYVRMYGTARGTGWGYSLYEFQVMS